MDLIVNRIKKRLNMLDEAGFGFRLEEDWTNLPNIKETISKMKEHVVAEDESICENIECHECMFSECDRFAKGEESERVLLKLLNNLIEHYDNVNDKEEKSPEIKPSSEYKPCVSTIVTEDSMEDALNGSDGEDLEFMGNSIDCLAEDISNMQKRLDIMRRIFVAKSKSVELEDELNELGGWYNV